MVEKMKLEIKQEWPVLIIVEQYGEGTLYYSDYLCVFGIFYSNFLS